MGMAGKAGEVFTDINVTPLTDVFLVLLVIMILIAPLVNQTVLKVDPPSTNQSQTKPPEEKVKINVDVTAQGTVKVNGNQINPPDSPTIAEALKQEQTKAGTQDIPVYLQSEPDALEKYVVAVMDACAGTGIKRLQVMPLKTIGAK